MPYAVNDNVRTWYEVEGSGPSVVLHTGFLGCLEDWRRDEVRYAQALRDRHRLILIDPRGQGRSDSPHDSDSYLPETRAGDIVAVLDDLGVDRAHYWGYSMGGTVGFMLAARHQDRLRSLIIGGASPYWTAPNPEADDWDRWMADGMDVFVAEFERAFGPLPEETRVRWQAGDAEALRASMRAPDRAAELAGALPRMTLPALLYAGTNDDPEPIERAASLTPHATFVPLDGLSHMQAWGAADLMLPQVTAFLDKVEQGSAGA